GAGEVGGAGARVGGQPAGAGPVGGRAAGRAALAGVDGDGVGGAVLVLVLARHRRQAQAVAFSAGQRRTHETGTVPDEEGHQYGGGLLGGEDQIAIVLAIIVVEHYDPASGRDLGQSGVDGVETRGGFDGHGGDDRAGGRHIVGLDQHRSDQTLMRGCHLRPTSSRISNGARGRAARGGFRYRSGVVLFHPDCDRRLRDRTGICLSPPKSRRALAGSCDPKGPPSPPVGNRTPPRELPVIDGTTQSADDSAGFRATETGRSSPALTAGRGGSEALPLELVGVGEAVVVAV